MAHDIGEDGEEERDVGERAGGDEGGGAGRGCDERIVHCDDGVSRGGGGGGGGEEERAVDARVAVDGGCVDRRPHEGFGGAGVDRDGRCADGGEDAEGVVRDLAHGRVAVDGGDLRWWLDE